MQEKLEIGDIVYLKSGSPAMTIFSFGGNGDASMVNVTFFLTTGAGANGTYPLACLTREKTLVGAVSVLDRPAGSEALSA